MEFFRFMRGWQVEKPLHGIAAGVICLRDRGCITQAGMSLHGDLVGILHARIQINGTLGNGNRLCRLTMFLVQVGQRNQRIEMKLVQPFSFRDDPFGVDIVQVGTTHHIHRLLVFPHLLVRIFG